MEDSQNRNHSNALNIVPNDTAASSPPPGLATSAISKAVNPPAPLELLQSLFDLSPNLLAVVHLKSGAVLHSNQAWRSTLGVNENSLLGKPWSGVLTFLNVQTPPPPEFAHLTDEHGLIALRSADKKTRWFTWIRSTLPNNAGVLWTGVELLATHVIFDARAEIPPEIENAQSSLNIRIDQFSEHGSNQIREVIEHMPGILFELASQEDGSFKFVYSSSNSKKLFGLTPEEVYKCDPSELFLTRDFPGLLIELFDSQQNGKSISWEGRLKSPDTMGYWVQVYATPMSRGPGKTVWYGLMLDIQQQRIAEMSLELERAKAFGAAKMAALGEMTAGVAHEINNPLAVILGKAEQLGEIAASGEFDPKWIADGAEKIIRMSQRISKIIRGLRSFARDAENDPMESKSLNQVIEDSIELCQARFRSKNVMLTVQNFEPDVFIECRAVQISQVILNLLNNAFDAIQEFEQKWVKLESSKVGDRIRISITDCGAGISPDVVTHIMAPFFTTKAAGKGTGLGLSISCDIAQAHTGKLFVDHERSNTTFVIDLPMAQPKAPRLKATPSQNPSLKQVA